MKTGILLGTVLLFFFTAGFTACDNGDMRIWDIYPIVLSISVQDAQGNDLLNPETPGSIAHRDIKALYQGKTYEKDSVVYPTRAYLAQLKGLCIWKGENGLYYLTFGEFDGARTFDNEQVVIDWNDGTEDVLAFSSKLYWNWKKEPVIDRVFFLNGVEIASPCGEFTVIKEPDNGNK